jgi:predicted alpha/beta hydrolase family esterase
VKAPVLILPGIGGSGPEHWQSHWEALEPTYRRIQMPDWDRPEISSWLSAIDVAVAATPSPPVIVAHSLGCLALAHWASRGGAARAALLVAVPDPQSPEYPDIARSFEPVPLAPIEFPTLVVASRNDPYGSFAFNQKCAQAWGCGFSDIGLAGHINAESGLGDWAEGRALLAGLLV